MTNTTDPPPVVPRPGFFKRTRKSWSAAAAGFVTGCGGMFTILAESQEFTKSLAAQDALNIIGGGLGAAAVGWAGVFFTSNEIDPQGTKFKALFNKVKGIK